MEALLALGAVFMVVGLLIGVFFIITLWFMFEKAGQPGWAAIIPIYNVLILLKVAGKEWWWIFGIFLGIIPVVGWILVIVWHVLVANGISKNFGKEVGFTVGLVLLGIVFYPILAFGNAKYNAVETAPTAPAPEVNEEAAPEAPTE